MANACKRKLLFATLFLIVLLAPIVYSTLIPSAHAAEMPNQQKGLSILGNVVGLDLTKYAVTAKETPADSQASYLGVVPQENVAYDLTSDGSKVKMLYTFANGKLQMIQVLEREGPPSLVKPATTTNAVALAYGFLSNYQAYTGDPLFGKLKSTLNTVVPGKNLTKTLGNTVLETIVNDGYTNFKWYYSANGAVAPYSKFITLCFKDGFLSFFVDNWQFYSVGSTAVNLSEKEAVAIALEAAKAHSWTFELEADALDAENFNEANVRWTSLIFDNSLDASKTRSEDQLELYPVWRVGIALNKWYGYMYGIQVDIWADTKEVRSVQEAWSTLPPPEDAPIANVDNQAAVSEAKPNLAMLVALPALAATTTGTALFWMSRKKKVHYYSLLRPRVVKAGGIMLCVLISSMILLASIATVNATTRVGVVWGSESKGAYGYDLPLHNYTWRKSQPEIYWQKNTAGNISLWFGANGYTGINHQGNLGSSRGQILNDVLTFGSYDYAAVVDFDHGIGGFPGAIQGYPVPGVPSDEFHYMFEDNVGTITGNYSGPHYENPLNAVYDMDVYMNLSPGKVKFALINTCLSACIADYVGGYYAEQRLIDGTPPWSYDRPVGMPLAWTRRFVSDIDTTQGFNITYYISDDGYGDPDMGSQVYIGFPYGSASLSQKIPYPNGASYYAYWVYYFFYWALYDDVSVNQALDSASYQVYGYYFGNCPLRDFTAYWWNANPETMPDCTMAVYGNGNIHLKNYAPPPHSVAVRYLSGPSLGNVDTSYQFSASAADSQDHRVRYLFDWGDGTQNVTDYYPSYAAVNMNHSWSSGTTYSVTVSAQCENGQWSSPRSHQIHIINSNNYHWLTVYAKDYSGYPISSNIYIDGQWAGVEYASVEVNEGWHTVLVDDPAWSDLYGCYAYLWYFTPYNGGNGDPRLIISETEITAVYYYW
jgi:hypothetical protein